MELNPFSRKLYTVELAVTNVAGDAIPDAGPWEASFDGGVTWTTAVEVADHTGWWEWLVAGPKVTEALPVGATLAATLTETVQPIGRLVDNPEVVAEHMPRIYFAS